MGLFHLISTENGEKKLFLLPPSGQNAQIKHKKFLPFQNILNI